MNIDAAHRAYNRDEIYRERPPVSLPNSVTFTNDGGRAVPAPVAFDARQRLGAWRLEA